MRLRISEVVSVLLVAVATTAIAASDWALVTANLGRQTCATNGEVILVPRLNLVPPRKTLMAGDAVVLRAQGCTNPVTWFMVDQPSGGTLTALDETAVTYHAGAVSSCVDVVQAWDGENGFGRAYFNVISGEDVARAGKAIVIAGRKSPDDPLWPVTDYLADLGYGTLLYRGFARSSIQYLSPDTQQDVDGNGAMDDIDAPSTLAQARQAFTSWALHANRLFVYLVDHGGDSSGEGYFRLNPTETLTARQLDLWLDALQDAYNTEVTVVIDCCYSGSFLDELTYAGPAKRIVLTACNSAQPTYFLAGGLISFSDAFFGGVLLGLDTGSAFQAARSAMAPYQSAWLDDNGDGVCDAADGAVAAGVDIGASFVAGKDIPHVGLVLGNQLLQGATTATLWADDVISIYPIERVWCMIIPPGHNPDPANPVGDVPELELTYDPTQARYQASYDGFAQEGIYKVAYYARDIWGSVSFPRESYVTQAGFDERIIIATGGATTDVQWAQADYLAGLAFHTFRGRSFHPDAIQYLSASAGQDMDRDGTNDVDDAATLATLAYAITNWAAGANKLTVCLVGIGTNGQLRLNAAETLGAASMDGWLDTYQASNADAIVLMDFSGAGGFLPGLQPSESRTRICLASTLANQSSCMVNAGRSSFLQYFLTEIFHGCSVGQAFQRARDAVRLVTGKARQQALMDDNGDGACDSRDGPFARTRFIGCAFITGADVPAIGAVTPDGPVAAGEPLRLWASGVTDMNGISNVWCVVTTPDYAGTGELPRTNLTWNAAEERYEAWYNRIDRMGSYVLTFHAEDVLGDLSSPVQAELQAMDGHEPDDAPEQAGFFIVDTSQRRNLHASNDVDWVQFFAVTDYVYTVETIHVGTNADTALDVYRQLPDGTLTNIDPDVDFGGVGLGEGEITWLEPEASGLYYVRVRHGQLGGGGDDTEYDLRIWIEAGPEALFVVAVDKFNQEHCPPGTVVYEHDGSAGGSWQPHAIGAANNTSFWVPEGGRWIWVPTPDGYLPEEDPAQPGQVDNPLSYAYGNPKWVDASAWPWVVFQFVPVVRVTNAVARDAWTGEPVTQAGIAFRAVSGPLTGKGYDRHPNGAVYAQPWTTGPDGRFPTNVWLPRADWALRVSDGAHATWRNPSAIVSPATGAQLDLGTLWMVPLDADSNGVADAWQALHFPGGGFSPTNDTDRDGHDDGTEYGTGTDPTNAASVLSIEEVRESGPGGFTLNWPTVPWRTYLVDASADLLSNRWPHVFGPREATSGQHRMSWTDTNAVPPSGRFYRIGVVPP